RTVIEDHAGVADDALGVRPHAIALQRAAPAVESMKDGVDRRQATDAAAILVGRDAVEERLRVALLHRLEHLAVFGLDPRALGPGDRAWIAEARAHVREIGAGDQRDRPPARLDGLAERIQESGDARVVGGTAAARQSLVSKTGQHWHDR